MKLGAALVLGTLALGAACPALADSHSASYSDWTIAGDLTTLKFVLPEIEARRLTGVDVPLATSKKLGEYLLAHAAVTGDGENCAPIDQGYDIGLVDPLAVGPGSFGFEVFRPVFCRHQSRTPLLFPAIRTGNTRAFPRSRYGFLAFPSRRSRKARARCNCAHRRNACDRTRNAIRSATEETKSADLSIASHQDRQHRCGKCEVDPATPLRSGIHRTIAKRFATVCKQMGFLARTPRMQ